MAELADARDLGSRGAILAGSTPVPGTTFQMKSNQSLSYLRQVFTNLRRSFPKLTRQNVSCDAISEDWVNLRVALKRTPANSPITLPAHAQRRIYWSQQQGSKRWVGTAFILVGYCPNTLAYFQVMFDDAQKTFRTLNAAHVTCGQVTRSSSIQGFTLITFPVIGPRKEYKGWGSYEGNVDFTY